MTVWCYISRTFQINVILCCGSMTYITSKLRINKLHSGSQQPSVLILAFRLNLLVKFIVEITVARNKNNTQSVVRTLS